MKQGEVYADNAEREECAGDTERGRMQTSETVEIHVDDVERGGCNVGNGLDRGRVDVVVDDRATLMQTDNRNTVLGVTVEGRLAIAITKWIIALLGRQQ